MKNLPDIFPIRYAIIISDWLNKDDSSENEKPQFYTPATFEMLFRQMLLALQKEPLSEELLMPKSETIKFKFMDVEIIKIAKLNAPFNWANTLGVEIPKIIPEAKRSSIEVGSAFDIGLYSYRGASEIPSFITAGNILAKHGGIEGHLKIAEKFGYVENGANVRFLYDNYKRLRNNEITSFQLYESMAKYAKPIYISTPYSKVWEVLDGGFQNGIVKLSSKFNIHDFIGKIEMDDKKRNYGENKITVAVCKSWEELFAEEISAVYKILNFCNNCGKALPFDYQGKYCPATKGNEECTRARARKRAKKSQV